MISNPYYNDKYTRSAWSGILDSADGLSKSVQSSPMAASNPYVMAGAMAVDMVADPLKETADFNNKFDQLDQMGNFEESFDSQGNMLYDSNYKGALTQAQDDYDSYYNTRKEDWGFDDYLSEVGNPAKMFTKIGRSIGEKTGVFGKKKRAKLDAKQAQFENYQDNITKSNLQNTKKRNNIMQMATDRQKRLRNLNRMNVY